MNPKYKLKKRNYRNSGVVILLDLKVSGQPMGRLLVVSGGAWGLGKGKCGEQRGGLWVCYEQALVPPPHLWVTAGLAPSL